MTPATLTMMLGGLAGASVTAGLVMLVVGVIGSRHPHRSPRLRISRASGQAWPRPRRSSRYRMRQRVRWAAAPALGLLVWLISGWLVAGLIAAAIVLGAPALFGTTQAARRELARLEALQAWTRRLADLRTAGGGLEQTLTASVKTCPEPIKPEVTTLIARMRAGWRIDAALRAFADDMAEPAADLVVAVLLLDTQRRGTGVAGVLDDLADTVAEEVTMRRKIEADRAKPRTSARIVTAITLAAAGFGALNPVYIQPYGTPLGQLVLAGIAAGIAACLYWMRRVALGAADPRFLTASEEPGIPDHREKVTLS